MKRTTQLKKCARIVAILLATAVLLHSMPAAFAQPNPEATNRRQPPAEADRRGDCPQPGFQPGRAMPMLEQVLTGEQPDSPRAGSRQNQRPPPGPRDRPVPPQPNPQ